MVGCTGDWLVLVHFVSSSEMQMQIQGSYA